MNSPGSKLGTTAEGTEAAVAPPLTPISAAEGPPAALADTPAEAVGRRTLSTAFVRVGPDGLLTIKLKNGNVLVLHNVIMQPKDYCGETVLGGPSGKKYCGGYAEVTSARPGNWPTIE